MEAVKSHWFWIWSTRPMGFVSRNAAKLLLAGILAGLGVYRFGEDIGQQALSYFESFGAEARKARCIADDQPKLNYEHGEYQRWADKLEACSKGGSPFAENGHYPENNCERDSTTLAKHKARLEAAKKALANCSQPT